MSIIDDIKEEIRREFAAGEISYIDAIMELESRCGMLPKEAEDIVETWEGEDEL